MDMNTRHSYIITDTGKQEILFDCKFCNRKFVKTTINKHTVVCEKMSKQKRVPFNIKALRLREVNEKLKQDPKIFNSWGGGFKSTSSMSCTDIQQKVIVWIVFVCKLRLLRFLHLKFMFHTQCKI